MTTKPKYKSTIRQKNLVKEILNNPKQSLKTSLSNVGYAKSLQDNPSLVLKKPSFIELLDSIGLTDQRLAELGLEGLNATRLVIHGSEVLEPPDNAVRHKYYDTILKAKGHLTNNTNVLINSNDYKVFITED